MNSIVRIKKSLIRRVAIHDPAKPGGRRELVIAIQPDGLIVLRWSRGRKRYGIKLEWILEKAQAAGPLDGILRELLDEKTRQKGGKYAKRGGNSSKENLGSKQD